MNRSTATTIDITKYYTLLLCAPVDRPTFSAGGSGPAFRFGLISTLNAAVPALSENYNNLHALFARQSDRVYLLRAPSPTIVFVRKRIGTYCF